MSRNKRSILGFITHNWGLKIISFLAAIALWIVVVSVNDPTIRYSWANVPVSIENTDVITSNGQIYEILDGSDVVPKVTITAPKSIIQNIDKSDIVAVADMTKVSEEGEIKIDFAVSRYASMITNIKGSIDTVKVNVENKRSAQFVLYTNVIGTAKEGYLVGNVSTDQNLIRVSGPESVIERIESARVDVDMNTLSDFTSDITTSTPVHLYDADGKIVDNAHLEMKPENVLTTVEILSTKDVALNFNTESKPADGYGLTGQIAFDPMVVKVAGKRSVLASVSEINIPSEALDVTGYTSNANLVVNITKYLPDGISIAGENGFAGDVAVVVGIEAEETRDIELVNQDVITANVPEGYTVSFEELPDEYKVSVTGIESAMNVITPRAIYPTFDVKTWMAAQEIEEIQPGEYSVTLSFHTPERTRVNTVMTLKMTVEKEEDAEKENE